MVTNQKKEKNTKLDKQVKLLADPNKSDLLNFAQTITPNSIIIKEVDNQKTIDYIEQRKDEVYSNFGNFNKVALTKEELLHECVKYNKIYIPIKDYSGVLVEQDYINIKEFCTKNGLVVSDTDYQRFLYVLVDRKLSKLNDKSDSLVSDSLYKPIILFKMSDANMKGDVFFPIGNEKDAMSIKSWFNGLKNMTKYTLALTAATVISLGSIVATNVFMTVVPIYVPFAAMLFGTLLVMGAYNKMSNSHVFSNKYNYNYNNKVRDVGLYTILCVITMMAFYSISNNVSIFLRGNESTITTHSEQKVISTEDEVKKFNITYNPKKQYTLNKMYETRIGNGIFLPKETKFTGDVITSKDK